jgi:hypothetical protein
MKKLISLLPFLLIIIVLLISCSGKKIEKRVLKIDSLAKVMDSVDQKLKQISKDTIANRYHTYQRTLDSVAKYIKEIRNDESWKFICAYQEVRKPFKTMTINYDLYRAEIDSTIKQLLNLKHDVEQKLISDKEFDAFIQNESNSVNAVFFKVSKNIENVSLQMKNFDTIHPYLINILNHRKSSKKTIK